MRRVPSPELRSATLASLSRLIAARCFLGRNRRHAASHAGQAAARAEEGEVERIGADKPITVDVRVVVATHRNLEQLG